MLFYSAPVRSEGSTGSVPMLFKTENVWKGVNDPHDENIDLGHANGVVIAGDSLSSKALFRRLASSCFDLEKNILEHCGKKEMYSTRKYSIDEIESVLVDAYSPTGHALSTLVQALVYTNEEKKAMQDDQEFGSNAIPYDEDIEKFNIPYVMNALNDFDGYYHPNSVAPTIIEGFRTALLSNSLKDLGPLHLSLVGVPISGILRPLALDSFRYDDDYVSFYLHTSTNYLLTISLFRYTKTINFFKHSSNRWMFERNGHLEKALLSSLAETFNWIDSSFPKSTKELLKPSNKGLITPRKYVDWKWADAHLVTFLHPVTRVAEILDTFWSVGPVRGIGGLDTVLRTSYRNDIGLSNPDALSSSHSFVTTNR